MAHERIKLGTRAQVRAAKALDAAKLLTLAKERAPNPDIFETYDPSFWQARASSNRLDFYYTRMRPGRNKTLGNFKRGLDEGVSYLDSHNSRQNGLGQSIGGQLVRTDEIDPELGKPIEEVWGDFFTLRDVTINGHSSNDFIALIGAGVWRDVSVGFFASDIECGLCGKQVFDWWAEDGCPHLPGLEYDTEDGGKVTAWAWINDGELSEVSQVYDGASPGAAVVKAEQMSVEGALDEGSRSRLERRYNTRIALPERHYALGGVPLIGRGGDMGKRQQDDTEIRTAEELEAAAEAEELEEQTSITEDADEEEGAGDEDTVIEEPEGDDESDDERSTDDDVLSEARARFAPHGIKIGRSPAQTVRVLGDEIIRLRERLKEREGEAEIGKRYRAELIDAVIGEGIRARGDKFNETRYRGILERLDIDEIRAIGEDYGYEGNALFPGGRRTAEQQETPPPAESQREVDDHEAYQA